jgi:hypothetical protein
MNNTTCTANNTIKTGTPVIYFGSLTEMHGKLYYIGTEKNLHVLGNKWGQQIAVRRQSFRLSRKIHSPHLAALLGE